MREILFYRSGSSASPIEDFLESLNSKQAKKVTWVLKLIEDSNHVPSQYFKKLENTSNLWEIRVQVANNIFRMIGFFNNKQNFVICHGFTKKSQKIQKKEIEIAEKRKALHKTKE